MKNVALNSLPSKNQRGTLLNWNYWPKDRVRGLYFENIPADLFFNIVITVKQTKMQSIFINPITKTQLKKATNTVRSFLSRLFLHNENYISYSERIV